MTNIDGRDKDKKNFSLTPIIRIDEEKCINCYACVTGCPVKHCMDGSGKKLRINADLCIGCGNCITVCTHGARNFIDDTTRFIQDIEQGEKVIAVLDSAIASFFPEKYLNLNGYLSSLGVEAFFDASFGEELTAMSYFNHIKEKNPRMVIAQSCPAIVSFIEIYCPKLLPYLIPADSPALHTIKMIREYYPEYKNFKIAVISPCIAKRREFDETGLGDYNVTMAALKNYMVAHNVNLSSFPLIEFSGERAESEAEFFNLGGLLNTAKCFAPDIKRNTHKIKGIYTVYPYLEEISELPDTDIELPLLIDCMNCEKGCNGGPGTGNVRKPQVVLENPIRKRRIKLEECYNQEKEDLAYKKHREVLEKYWKKGLYERSYIDYSGDNTIKYPYDVELTEIYRSMKKFKIEDLYNCTSCGYGSCYAMATAIHNKLNKPENCAHFIQTLLKEEKEKAENLVRSRGDFLAKMSHEIRTPMNAIIGMAELALREDIPDAACEHILTIKQAGANLLSIINDILDFSKIESGKLEIVQAEYLFSSLINDVISIIRMKVLDLGLLFVTNIDCNIPNALFGDEIRVRQIFLNILSNAVKYTQEGFVSLTVTAEAGSGVNGDNIINLRIDVKDSGKGIKREDIDKLFGDFVQFDLIKNRGIEGTGLGLAITRNLVEAMGGKISVDSEYGKGSTFTVTLPQKVRSPENLVFVDKPADKSVLLYEQREIYSDSIISALENLGVKCTLVTGDSMLCENIKNKAWPFIFISSELLENAAQILSPDNLQLPDAKIVVLAKFGEVFANKDLCVLTMPAHSVSIANTLNGVTINSTFSVNKKTESRFTAPEARVLVVDDINTNLKVAEGLLQPYKMALDLCKSGHEAIEAVKRKPYDLVFMDHMMPDMDGIEATAIIRKWEKEQHEKNVGISHNQIPVIALTANAVLGMREMFIENDFNDFLTKPIDISKLDEILERWIPEEKKEKQIKNEKLEIKNEDFHIDNHTQNSKESKFLTSHSSFLDIPGIDVQQGIVMTGGTEAGYLAVLSMFQKDVENRLPLLQAMPEKNSLPSFTTQVHALKSASASIGAAQVSVLAAELEDAGRKGNLALIEKKLSVFTEQLAELAKNIGIGISHEADGNMAHNETQSSEKPLLSSLSSSSYVFNSLLRELASALKSQKAEDIDRIMDQLTPLDTYKKAILEKISDDILMTEFDNALKKIDEVL